MTSFSPDDTAASGKRSAQKARLNDEREVVDLDCNDERSKSFLLIYSNHFKYCKLNFYY